jgi:hypothetical protein
MTLGMPKNSSRFVLPSVEEFTLRDGVLLDQNGYPVEFVPITYHDSNSYGVTDSSILKGLSYLRLEDTKPVFCVDYEGYLVSTAPLGIPSHVSR